MEVVLKGDVVKIIRIMESLKKEDVAPPLLLWGLTEQVRKLVESKPDVLFKVSQKDMLRNLSIVHQKSLDVCAANNKVKTSDLLKQCSYIDRVIKGRAYGDSWRELLQLSIATRLSV